MRRTMKKRILTWTLLGLGLAILALGTVLFLTMPAPGGPTGRQFFGYGYGMQRGDGSGAEKDGKTPEAAPNGNRDRRDFPPPIRGFGPGHRFGPMSPPYGMHGVMGPGMGGFGILICVLLVLALILFFVRSGMHRHGLWAGHGTEREEDALSILRRDYAEGRISDEEYKKRLSVLKE